MTAPKIPDNFENIISDTNADLGLFYQLLEMVDGDWSDSIKGICEHIMERFQALAVFLTVFDRKYNEFIYFVYTATESSVNALRANSIDPSLDYITKAMERLYSINKRILTNVDLNEKQLLDIAIKYFDGDSRLARKFLADFQLKSLFGIKLRSVQKNFKSFIHILSDRTVVENDKQILNEYINQLNVALEIVYLVRELYIKATHDGLTKLFNHKQGHILLERELNRAERTERSIVITMADIDEFKKVNDVYGHPAGDTVLSNLGRIFHQELRKSDIVSRFGGEEFLIVFPETKLSDALDVIKRLKNNIQEHQYTVNDETFSVTVSFGVAVYDRSIHSDVMSFIDDADKKLYKAKVNGRNRIEH